MYENLLKLIQQAETADRIGKIENVVGMSMEASGGRSGIVKCYTNVVTVVANKI